MRPTSLIWLSVLFSAGACTCLEDGGGSGGGSGGGGTSGAGGGGALEPPREECLLDQEDPTPELMEAAYRALVENSQEGVSEAPLTPKGCMFARRTVVGGKVKAFAILRNMGTEFPFFPLDGGFETVTVAPLARWTIDLNGTTLGEIDDDGNASIDVQTEEVVDSANVLQRSVRTRFVTAPLVAPRLAERLTITRISPTRLSLTHERQEGSSLQVVRAFDYEPRQKACSFANTPDTDVPCMPLDKAEVTARMVAGLAKGVSCMKKGDLKTGETLDAVGKAFARGFELTCYVGNETEAQVDTGTFKADGKIQLYVNRGLLEPGCDPNRVASTLFHEAMHLVIGGHDPYDDIAKPNALANDNSDPVRACEALCFGAAPTRCNCAVCLGAKACDPRCAGLAKCVVRPPDGGQAVMSEAVGAECRNPAYAGAMGSSPGTWHTTMMDCRSSCAHGSTQCKSKSVSCDPSCN